MPTQLYQPIVDQYTQARGGYSTLFSIVCSKCRHEVFLYQKDGPGDLLRFYVDKILAPKEITHPLPTDHSGFLKKHLQCPACKRVLAAPIVYEKENRLAYRLFVGAIKKYKTPGHFPKFKKSRKR